MPIRIALGHGAKSMDFKMRKAYHIPPTFVALEYVAREGHSLLFEVIPRSETAPISIGWGSFPVVSWV